VTAYHREDNEAALFIGEGTSPRRFHQGYHQQSGRGFNLTGRRTYVQAEINYYAELIYKTYVEPVSQL